MTPGTVLFDPSFQFHDGATAPKLFIILNDGTAGFYIAIRTTSRQKTKGQNEGCQSDDRPPNFFVPDGKSCIRGDTWLLLNDFYEFNRFDLLGRRMSGKIDHIGTLPHDVTVELLACAIESFDITSKQRDILQEVLNKLPADEPERA